ncbi:hypothetical protein [Brevibacillus sp. SYSU BS000544]|uniref:hypothetical protein n=1 Tax=Brevibacillus sp. SYSU BS000544 TaxID=3416443 RepID=UPI003CE4C500
MIYDYLPDIIERTCNADHYANNYKSKIKGFRGAFTIEDMMFFQTKLEGAAKDEPEAQAG